MNTSFLVTSFKKEIWEFNKTLFWMPIIIAALMLLAPAVQLMLFEDYQINRIFMALDEVQHVTQLEHFDKMTMGAITAVFMPFIMVGLLIQLYYFVACLFDERRDLSVFFWRSLPVSDASTIGVKLATGALVIPGIFMLGATLALLVFMLFAFLACIVLAVGYDISLWHLWGNASLFTNWLSMWAGLIPYALWMFPVYAWLMLASMFAKKGPFLWAVLPLVAVLLVEAFVVEYFRLEYGFFSQTLFDYFAFGSDMMHHNLAHSESVRASVLTALFSKVDVVGILFGCALIYATYWLRVNRSQP